jgi:cell division protein ZapA
VDTKFSNRQEVANLSQDEKQRVTVNIHNRTYTIVGKESGSHVRLVASLVDQKMKEIQSMNRQLDAVSLAVLTAVNTMNDYQKLKEDYATLLGSFKKKEDK